MQHTMREIYIFIERRLIELNQINVTMPFSNAILTVQVSKYRCQIIIFMPMTDGHQLILSSCICIWKTVENLKGLRNIIHKLNSKFNKFNYYYHYIVFPWK